MSNERDRIAELERKVNLLQTMVAGMPVRLPEPPSPNDALVYLGIVQSGGIGAADWESDPPELGSGTVQPYNLDSEPYLECPSGGSPAEETWYNIAPVAIDEDRVAVAVDWQGIKIVIVETCDTVTVGCT